MKAYFAVFAIYIDPTMREILFQRLWQHLAFRTETLVTTCGKPVIIYSPGELNPYDGPDFSNSHLKIGHQTLSGQVELHILNRDWYAHGHHKQPSYRATILHVCLEPEGAAPVRTDSGQLVPTLVLKSHLHTRWQQHLQDVARHSVLTCSGFLHMISPGVVEHQLRHAARLYFDIKRNQLFEWFDASRPPSDAYMRMVWIGICDALGIPANREPMKQLAINCWDYTLQAPFRLTDCRLLVQEVFRSAETSKTGSTAWKHKTGRPSNRVPIRLEQAAEVLFFLKTEGFKWFVTRSVSHATRDLKRLSISSGHRGTVIRHTVLLPAMHILGTLLHKPPLQREAETAWMEGRIHPPVAIESVFKREGGVMESHVDHPGILPQYRYFCSQTRCNACYIFKNIVGG